MRKVSRVRKLRGENMTLIAAIKLDLIARIGREISAAEFTSLGGQ